MRAVPFLLATSVAALALAACDAREVRTTHYAGGTPWSEVRYAGGRPDGVWRTWWENGNLKSEGGYADGELHGAWRTWFEDGAPQTEQFFANGRPELTWTHWYQTGAMVTRGGFKGGVKEGVWEEWFGDGTLKARAEFAAGISTGQATVHDAEGRMLSRTTYDEEGRPCYLELWNTGGVLWSRAEGPTRDDRRNGEWTAYDLEGEVLEEYSGLYVDDVLQKEAASE
jgi:antitoxin component YwqK of YwqJK toxin-antitoxin module